MDPRTSSKVTAPDLVKAFREGMGRDEEDSGHAFARFYVLILDESDNPIAKGSYDQRVSLEAFEFISRHVNVPGHGAIIKLLVDEPEGWEQLAISAPGD